MRTNLACSRLRPRPTRSCASARAKCGRPMSSFDSSGRSNDRDRSLSPHLLDVAVALLSSRRARDLRRPVSIRKPTRKIAGSISRSHHSRVHLVEDGASLHEIGRVEAFSANVW
jgi:hypothetical protein